MTKHNSAALLYNDKALNELHDTITLLKTLHTYCLNKEFTNEYYGIPKEYINMVSNERNEYIALILMAIEKNCNIKHLNLCIEHELSLLQEDTNNCSR